MRGEGARLPISINSTGFERRRRRRKGSWVSPGSVSGLTLAVWEKKIGEETRLSVRKISHFSNELVYLAGKFLPYCSSLLSRGRKRAMRPLGASSSHSFGRHCVSKMPRLRLLGRGQTPRSARSRGKSGRGIYRICEEDLWQRKEEVHSPFSPPGESCTSARVRFPNDNAGNLSPAANKTRVITHCQKKPINDLPSHPSISHLFS